VAHEVTLAGGFALANLFGEGIGGEVGGVTVFSGQVDD